MVSTEPWPTRAALERRLRAAGCVFAEDEARLLRGAAGSPAELADMVQRRIDGVPVEHVVGWAQFCGLRIAVEPGVFVPRRRTEHLARRAVELGRAAAGQSGRTITAVDLCCGSGAIGAVLVAALDRVELHATDLDPIAVRCARHNLAPAGGHVYQGDLFDPLPASLRGRVDVLVANVPYVPTGELGLLPSEAREHEPRVALDGGPDGLDVLRRVAAQASGWLAPAGHLLVETGQAQAPEAAAVFARAGLTPQVSHSAARAATVLTGSPAG